MLGGGRSETPAEQECNKGGRDGKQAELLPKFGNGQVIERRDMCEGHFEQQTIRFLRLSFDGLSKLCRRRPTFSK